MKELILVPILILLLECSVCSCGKVSEAKQKEILQNVTTQRFGFWKENSLTGRSSRIGQQKQFKRKLPTEDRIFKEDYTPLECGLSYSIAREGYVYFDLAPGSHSCFYGLLEAVKWNGYFFQGSKNEGCTVAIYCQGTINLAAPNERGCDREYLILSDGTKGMMSGCGQFSFSQTPRYPRNGGSDMYIYSKGNDKNSVCIALCLEDLKEGMYGLSKAKKITKNKEFGGLWTENQCRCGVRGDLGRMVGGDDAVKEEFPWMAALVFPGERISFCGGSIINDRYILSAAHCFHGESVTKDTVEVLLRAHVLDPERVDDPNDSMLNDIPGWNLPKETDESEGSYRLGVSEIRIHPMFDIETYDYDYALLTLAQPISLLYPGISTICLPFPNENIKYQDQEPMTVSGWGLPWEDAPAEARVLQKLDVPFLNRKSCSQYTTPTERHICAGYLEGGRDSCAGDSGSPLVALMNPQTNQYMQSGVVSAGSGCAREGQLGLYSDIRETVQWIYFHTPGAVWCAR